MLLVTKLLHDSFVHTLDYIYDADEAAWPENTHTFPPEINTSDNFILL
jgi:hypothetical protein